MKNRLKKVKGYFYGSYREFYENKNSVCSGLYQVFHHDNAKLHYCSQKINNMWSGIAKQYESFSGMLEIIEHYYNEASNGVRVRINIDFKNVDVWK